MQTKFLLILISSIILSMPFSQNLAIAQTGEEMVGKAEMLEEGKPDIPDTTLKEGVKAADTTTINIGRRQIRIIEKAGDTNVIITDVDDSEKKVTPRRSRPFSGHWRGLELGLNNYVDSRFSTSLRPDQDFMELRTGKSRNVNLNILQYDFALSGNNVGLVTGLGFEFSNYRFTNNNNIMKEDRFIVPKDYDDLGIGLENSKLSTIYLTVPLLAEYQIPHGRRSHRIYFSAGIIGGLNIGSHTKIVYRENSRRQKDKVRDDFYLSPFRYGLTFRTGYRSLNLYANYYPTPLFQKNKGPELYPVAVGFSILGF